MEVFDHGDADVGVEGIAFEAVAAEGEVGGDGAVGDADDGAGGAGEVEVRGGFAEEGLREFGLGGGELGGEELGAEDFEAAAGDGGFGIEAVEVRGVGAGCVEQRHGVVKVCAWVGGCKWVGGGYWLKREGGYG